MTTLAEIAAQFKLEGKTVFQGLPIAIENDVGSVRQGQDKGGHKWRTVMKYPYGYIVGTKGKGMDGMAIDCYVGPNKDAKYAFVVHQMKPDTGKYDEDKVMLGFTDAAEAKAAYLDHYDNPKFFGSISAVPMAEFKKKVAESSKSPQKISGMAKAVSLAGSVASPLSLGDPVTVDGVMGRGVVVKKEGNRVTVRYNSGEYLSRDAMFVHPLKEASVNKMWQGDDNQHEVHSAKEWLELQEPAYDEKPREGSYIVQEGTQFCIKTNGVDKNLGCYPSREKAEAVMSGKSFIGDDVQAGRGIQHFGITKADKEILSKIGDDWTHGGKLSKRAILLSKAGYLQRDGFKFKITPKGKDALSGKDDAHLYAFSTIGQKQSGWQYGFRHPVGYIKPRTLAGLPAVTRVGKAGAPGTGIGKNKPLFSPHKPSVPKNAGQGTKKPNPTVRLKTPPKMKVPGTFKAKPNVPKAPPAALHAPAAPSMPHGVSGPRMAAEPRKPKLYGYGTSEGAQKAWDTRGRGRKAVTREIAQVGHVLKETKPALEKAANQATRSNLKGALHKLIQLHSDLGHKAAGHLHALELWGLVGSALKELANLPWHSVSMTALQEAHNVMSFVQNHMAIIDAVKSSIIGAGDMQADYDGGEPNTGSYSHGHIDPVTWFHPPSLTKRLPNEETRVPTDDPRETNDKYMDVTKRNSPDTQLFRMKLLKRQQPGAMDTIPVRTTLVSPHTAVYLPSMFDAAEKRRKRLKTVLKQRPARIMGSGRISVAYNRRGCV